MKFVFLKIALECHY